MFAGRALMTPAETIGPRLSPGEYPYHAISAGVPVSQAYEFYTGLRDTGIETELVIYPRERHSIQEYMHRLDVQKRMLAWFDKHLK